ncbi:Hypothetical_protein [Hexamita inflata]|uniref:Hypothetical_protein n=1 Tax=Hexamita inflata TaxID=28002 RepID=A0AA86QUM0_9EUKA|nr:Hypothetical protein HINF_LOCUS53989 [Hexamita inflata]
MTQRWRPSKDNKEYIETTFLQNINEKYKMDFIQLEDAVRFYLSRAKYQKLLFTHVWNEIDVAIKVNPDMKKSYSYKYITDVVVQRLSQKWGDDTILKAREFAISLICNILEGLPKTCTENEARQACKDVKALTFQNFNDFKNEGVQGTRKTMMDMLGHVIDSQVKAIRAENQIQHQATPNGSQKDSKPFQQVQESVTEQESHSVTTNLVVYSSQEYQQFNNQGEINE